MSQERMSFTKDEEETNALLVSTASGGNVEIIHHLIHHMNLNPSTCLTECLIAAYKNSHTRMFKYLASIPEASQLNNLHQLLKLAMKDKNIYVMCIILYKTSTKPTFEEIQLSVELDDIDILRFLTVKDYKDVYYGKEVERITNIFTFNRTRVEELKILINNEFVPVSINDNILLKRCSNPDSGYEKQSLVPEILKHPRYIDTKNVS